MQDRDSTDAPTDSWSQLLAAIAGCWPVDRWCHVGVVVGVSGGADSVALLRALCQLCRENEGARGFIVAAHFHHGIRGVEADRDAQFVRSLAAEFGLRHQQGHADATATDEATMRDARAAFLRQTAQNHGARYVALAHSADDNVETLLHHLMRGTGPKGLAGIPLCRPLGHDPIGQDLVLIRPLLRVRRALIREGLISIGQSWCEDSSNQDTTYRRNWIRSELLPLIQTKHPLAVDAIARTIDSQNQWKRIMDRLADDWIEQHVTFGGPVKIRSSDADSAIVIAALQVVWSQQGWPLGEMTQEHWYRVAAAIKSSESDRFTLPGGIDAQAGVHLELSRIPTPGTHPLENQ